MLLKENEIQGLDEELHALNDVRSSMAN